MDMKMVHSGNVASYHFGHEYGPYLIAIGHLNGDN